MVVWVVMGNGYPGAVFDNEQVAEAYCKVRQEESNCHGHRRINWRTYAFTLNNTETE